MFKNQKIQEIPDRKKYKKILSKSLSLRIVEGFSYQYELL